MSVLLITGTSTGVGKTIVTAALAAVAQTANVPVAVCKPAQTGVAAGQPGDLETIAALSGITETLELARYPDQLAPATAARIRNAPVLSLAETAAAITELDRRHPEGLVLVEGAGGLMVRLGEFTLLELAAELKAPVVVVAAAGLGTLNHTELTTRTLQAAGVCCAGIVIGSWPGHPDLAMRCNREDLPTVTGIDVVGIVPAGVGDWDPEDFRNLAPTWFAPYVLISQ